jgi:primary-amine oxidase
MPPLAQRHPLDPLTSAEILQTSSLLKDQHVNQSLHFKRIAIVEPPKARLRSFLIAERNGDYLPKLTRRASVLYYHRGTADLFSALVNLDSNSVENIEKLDSHFHGQADVDEIIEMRDMCLQNPKVLEEVKRFNLPDELELVGDTWPYGRDSDDCHPRYVQVTFLAGSD